MVSPEAAALIQQAVDQGRTREVTDPVVLAKVAAEVLQKKDDGGSSCK